MSFGPIVLVLLLVLVPFDYAVVLLPVSNKYNGNNAISLTKRDDGYGCQKTDVLCGTILNNKESYNTKNNNFLLLTLSDDSDFQEQKDKKTNLAEEPLKIRYKKIEKRLARTHRHRTTNKYANTKKSTIVTMKFNNAMSSTQTELLSIN